MTLNERNGAGYVLITPARNEEAFIELTIKSVVAQTVRPLKWVIVSDGSTDRTDEIVSKYAAESPWIELVRTPERKERNFAGKVFAFNTGYQRLNQISYDFIGCMDADISFDSEYFEFLLGKLVNNARLGLVGTPYREGGRSYDYRFVSIEHVSGACQLFRRECFEDIGGYTPIQSGGVDLVALLSARHKGWQTRTFTEKTCEHHRKMGAAHHSGFRERIHRGRMDFLLGSHPLWEICRGIYQMKNRPYLIGGLLILFGYAWTMLSGRRQTMPKELIRFRRRDQISQLRRIFLRGASRQHSEAIGQ
jgi:poly-beta-1,6-N-acetyl-D-glucosamine synthase